MTSMPCSISSIRRLSEQTDKGLSYDQGADKVYLKLLAILANGLIDERRGHSDSRVIDQAGQSLTVQTISNYSGSLSNGLLVSDIEKQRSESLSPFGAEPISIF